MSWKYLVPNACTALSLLLGLAAVVLSASGDFQLAAWLILWGVLLDKLDGAAARFLGASSEFGAEMDSFADFVSFGLAPSALLFFGLTGGVIDAEGEGTVAGACAVYALAIAIRLARFNVSEPEGSKLFFFGVPTTLCGALLASGWLTADAYGVEALVSPLYPAILIVLGALMVSNVRMPKFSLRWSKPVNAFQVVNLVVAYILVPLQMYPEYLFGLCASYVVIGMVWGVLYADRAVEESRPPISRS